MASQEQPRRPARRTASEARAARSLPPPEATRGSSCTYRVVAQTLVQGGLGASVAAKTFHYGPSVSSRSVPSAAPLVPGPLKPSAPAGTEAADVRQRRPCSVHSGDATHATESTEANVIHPVVAMGKDRLGGSAASRTFHHGMLGLLLTLIALCCSPCPGPPEPFRAGRGDGPPALTAPAMRGAPRGRSARIRGHRRRTPSTQSPPWCQTGQERARPQRRSATESSISPCSSSSAAPVRSTPVSRACQAGGAGGFTGATSPTGPALVI